jgi:hypothetical protein
MMQGIRVIGDGQLSLGDIAFQHKKAGDMGMPPADTHTHNERIYQARTSTTLRV